MQYVPPVRKRCIIIYIVSCVGDSCEEDIVLARYRIKRSSTRRFGIR